MNFILVQFQIISILIFFKYKKNQKVIPELKFRFYVFYSVYIFLNYSQNKLKRLKIAFQFLKQASDHNIQRQLLHC